MKRFAQPAIDNPQDLLFGQCLHPVTTRRGLTIGDGMVYPEVNFTLPSIDVTAENMPAIREHYEQMSSSVVQRAIALDAPGLVIEFETVPPMTEHPEWGLELAQIILKHLDAAHAEHDLPCGLRMTPNDNREFTRPPEMRSGTYWQQMQQLFESCAEAGVDMLSIESVGGKELHDEALVMCDLAQVIYSQCVLGARDMAFLWSWITEICERHDVLPAGDTACGFANTAMVLAEQRMIPRVVAAVVRAISAVRSLVAYEYGATGPGKDCGYENIILKAITGMPMSCEGKSATCAHFSPVGNVAAAACDLWSNESVQNVKLLAGMAPVCFAESLIYDCRLMNTAANDGLDARRQLARWLTDSDINGDPQAMMLSPESACRLARTITSEPDDKYRAGVAAAKEAITILEQAHAEGRLQLPELETLWLGRMTETLQSLPEDEASFIEQVAPTVDASRYRPADYAL